MFTKVCESVRCWGRATLQELQSWENSGATGRGAGTKE